jgi:tetratricopeptide (TPR) repeat protein
LSKRSEHSRLSVETLIERFVIFVQAETWLDSRRILKEHPELLSEEAIEVLRSWVLSIQDIKDKETSEWYKYHWGLLQASRLMGIDPMFENFEPSAGPPGGIVVPREFADDIQRLADLDNTASHNPAVHRDRIALMEKILQRLDGKTYPSFRGAVLINLGQVYAQLPTGSPSFNLAKASARFTEAAKFFTPKTAPPSYANSQNALGLSYMELTTGDPTTNLEKAIASFTEALRFRSPDYTPLDYADTKNNLGRAYVMLPGGDHITNLRRAIACFRDVLRIFTPEEAASERAIVQRNLTLATAELDRILREAH